MQARLTASPAQVPRDPCPVGRVLAAEQGHRGEGRRGAWAAGHRTKVARRMAERAGTSWGRLLWSLLCGDLCISQDPGAPNQAGPWGQRVLVVL